MINNYSHIGFLPSNSLQSSELNEIQERFYLDQTLQNTFLANWLILTENNSIITGLDSSPYLGPYVTNAIPINPNLIEAYNTADNIIVNLNIGWYKINNSITNNMSIWCYLDEMKTISLPISSSAGLYTVTLDVSFTDIPCSPEESEEGYTFNSNVGGYIEPWIFGSNRFKLVINDLQVKYPTDQTLDDLTIIKIRTGIDGIAFGRFLIQFNNNYKINDINI